MRRGRGSTSVLMMMEAVLLLPIQAIGASYYVSPSGNDSGSGSLSQPWRTIQHAADSALAGDTVWIRGGTYSERVVVANSGTPSAFITFSAYPGESATIDGNGVSVPLYAGLLDVSTRSHIRISGLRVINSERAGILADTTDSIIIEGVYTSNTVSSGIGIWNSTNATINSNEVVLACNNGDQECITVAGTNGFTITNNHVHDSGPGSNGGEGIDVKDGSSNGSVVANHIHHINRLGLYVDAWDKHTFNITVTRNLIHDCNADGMTLASEAGGFLENVTISNNVAHSNRWVGLTVANYGDPVPSRPMSNLLIVNNTFADNGRGGWGGGITVDDPDASGVTIRNNICSQNTSFQIVRDAGVPASNVTIDHNLIDGFRGYDGETAGESAVQAAPLFANAAGANFRLQSSSPAIDQGSSSGAPADDYDGTPRPQGAGIDMGAFEYAQGGGTTPVAAFSATPLGGPAPLAVQFSNLSSGSISSYAWTFGDATTSTDQNPSHTYASAGSYTVSLTVTGPDGSDSESKMGYVVVSSGSAWVSLRSPAAGAAWKLGSAKTIRWTYAGDVGTTARIELLNAGSLVGRIKSKASIGSRGKGSCRWRIPRSITPGGGFQIRLITNRGVTGISDASFTLLSP